MPPKKSRPTKGHAIPLVYRLFFLYIEPVSALAGAYFAYFQPHAYLTQTHTSSTGSEQTVAKQISTIAVLAQLANLYLLFAINEALVLRSTNDMRVWRTLLTGLLIADFGHLWSLKMTGSFVQVFVAFWEWNAIGWGNVAFVYMGIIFRSSFLLGLGFEN